MLIFGWGRRTIKNYGPLEENYCDHCKNLAHWELRKYTTWFTLFFIPVIPYSTKKFLICPICGSALELDSQTFNNLKDSSLGKDVKNDTNNNYSGKTKTQINYLKEMQKIRNENQGSENI